VRETVAGTTATTVYHDTWFDNLAIGYLSRQLQAASGSCLYSFAILEWSTLRACCSRLLAMWAAVDRDRLCCMRKGTKFWWINQCFFKLFVIITSSRSLRVIITKPSFLGRPLDLCLNEEDGHVPLRHLCPTHLGK
jgi:hypothetical protein